MRFHDLPIRRKLLLMTLTSTMVALTLASGGFLAWDIAQFRSEARQDMRAQSAILAENSGAPLAFRDDRVAGEILQTVSVRRRVQMACLYDSAGAVLTSYQRDSRAACPARPPASSRFGWQAFDVVTPVGIGRERVGTLYLRRDLGDMYARLRVAAAAVLGLLLLAFGAAFLTSARMQRSIARPLLQLADTAHAISTTRNYALRATAASNDEIGVVMRAFNEMLDRIGEALERERQAGRLKDEFLATLSHELRTPLTAMLGWARLLRSSRLDPAMESRALEIIERNARVQANLVDDLLDMSRIVSGRPRLRPADIDFADVVDAAVDVVQPAAAAKRLRLHVELAARPAMTHGDAGRLQQVVWNLLSNAVKFTPPEGQIHVRLERGGDGYRLSVCDTGPGIEPRFLPIVFEPFRQVDGTSSREYGGLGLGLAIAKQLVELHGGTIEARSDGRGTGATFEVRLPSVVRGAPEQVDRHRSHDPRRAATIDRSLLRGLRVLVVDDEADARALLETALTQYGAEVLTASNAADALAEIERHRPDVLVSDIGMPTEDGHMLIRKVRLRPASKGGSIPAIAITAYASVSDRLAAQAAGFQAHIAKPFEVSEVATLTATLGHPSQSQS